MTNVQSKCLPISTTCVEYVHPWTKSCWNSIAGIMLQSSQHSIRMYTAVYLLSMLMRGRIPSKLDIKRTIYGILQSSAFLSTNAYGYIMFTCFLRNLFKGFYFLTIGFIPAFIASFTAILLERPSRRILLALYVANVASETIWRMCESRGYVKSINHGQAIIFGISSSILLYFYRLGYNNICRDSLFNIFKFVIGKEEAGNRNESLSNLPPSPEEAINEENVNCRHTNNTVNSLKIMYNNIIQYLKNQKRHVKCPHKDSCAYYSLKGGIKLFSAGLGLQVTLKVLLQLRNVFPFRMKLRKTLFKKDTLKLGLFLGGFSLLYKSVSCFLRHVTGTDNPLYALPAALLASIAFTQYPDTTVALYVMWKMLQITYNIGIEKGVLPKVPGFTILLYCASTAMLFHAATFEPLNLRTSYWRFLHGLSGGRISAMDRVFVDVWGLNTTKAVDEIMKITKTANQPIRFAFS